jgi:Uncharacterized conserved protein
VLVFPTGKGSSVVQIDGLYQLEMNGNLPKAMIIKEPETVLICAAVLSNVPLVDRVEKDLLEVISTGDHVEVDSDRGTITLRKRLTDNSNRGFKGNWQLIISFLPIA